MKGYGEQVAARPFTTNQEDLLSLYGFVRGHGPGKKREPCARKMDLSGKRFDATAAFRCLLRAQIFLPMIIVLAALGFWVGEPRMPAACVHPECIIQR